MSTVIDQTFTAIVYDNFHYMEEDERWVAGEFSSYDEAIAECKRIVELSLQDGLSQKGPMSADQLYSYYTDFGDDPFVRPGPIDDTRFSAWGYAKERCEIPVGTVTTVIPQAFAVSCRHICRSTKIFQRCLISETNAGAGKSSFLL